MKSEYKRWNNAVRSVAGDWDRAILMPIDNEPDRISRAEAMRIAGALIVQLEFLAGLSIFGPDGRSIGMRSRLSQLLRYAESLCRDSINPVPMGAARIIDLGGPLTGGAAALEIYGKRSQDDAQAAGFQS